MYPAVPPVTALDKLMNGSSTPNPNPRIAPHEVGQHDAARRHRDDRDEQSGGAQDPRLVEPEHHDQDAARDNERLQGDASGNGIAHACEHAVDHVRERAEENTLDDRVDRRDDPRLRRVAPQNEEEADAESQRGESRDIEQARHLGHERVTRATTPHGQQRQEARLVDHALHRHDVGPLGHTGAVAVELAERVLVGQGRVRRLQI